MNYLILQCVVKFQRGLKFKNIKMASAPSASAIRALSLEYKGLSEDPVEGFRVKLLNEEDMFVWEVALFGPPDTLYQGGYFKVIISFVKYMIIVISNNSFLWCCVA